MMLVYNMMYISSSGARAFGKEPALFRELVKSIIDSDLWFDFKNFERSGTKKRSIKQLTQKEIAEMLVTELVNSPCGEFNLMTHRSTWNSSLFRIDTTPEHAYIQIVFREKELQRRLTNVLTSLIQFTNLTRGIVGTESVWGPDISLNILDLAYPRPRPPKFKNRWHGGTVLRFYDKRYYTSEEEKKILKRLLTAKTPRNIDVGEVDDLVCYRWLKDLTNDDETRRAMSEQEQWNNEIVDAPIEDDYNALGDKKISDAVESREDVTFYSQREKRGYYALWVDPDGTLNADELNKIESWIQSEKLPDSTPLKALDILAPSRETALMIRNKVISIGVDRVLYLAGKNKGIWNPFPPGMWLEEDGVKIYP